MVNQASPSLNIVYPICSRLLPGDIEYIDPMELPEFLAGHPGHQSGHAFLADLAAIERARYRLEEISLPAAEDIQQRLINPALELLQAQWRNLPEFLTNQTITP
ncbi:MAG: hypothetical protein GQ559_09170, partial [Desulfobulbaceae bacterium]|nr:hypothetical protein [Desulfobulbaceae bacterium]